MGLCAYQGMESLASLALAPRVRTGKAPSVAAHQSFTEAQIVDSERSRCRPVNEFRRKYGISSATYDTRKAMDGGRPNTSKGC